ncbi:MAG: ankyrin repeat domain-containing protein [Elusimicrobiota bacterium]
MLGILLLLACLPAFAADDPLLKAAQNCEVEELKKMFDSGEATSNPTGWDYPLIQLIAEGRFCKDQARHEAAVTLALERGLSLKARDRYAKTPLVHLVMEPSKTAMIEFLIAKGADVNSRDSSKNTPIFHAVLHGAVNNVRTLILRGAEVGAVNVWKETPLDWAKKHNQEEIADILTAAMAGKMPSPAPKAVARKAVSLAPQPAPAAAPPAAMKAATFPDEKPSFRRSERPEDFALVVGVESYSNELPRADFAERDANAVRAHLVALGVPERNIKVLLGSKASRSQLEAYLEDWLPRMARPSGRVFFYFSGHGAPDPKSGEAYLVPVDGDPKFLSRTGFPLKRLYSDLAALKAGRVIVALDSCFSGSGGRSVLAAGTRPLVNQIKTAVPAGTPLTIFTATSAQETTGTLPELGHGIFTYHFLKSLREAAATPKANLTARALYDALKPRVQDEAARQNRDQTPGLTGPSVELLGQ